MQRDSACIKANAEKLGEVMGTKFFEPVIVPGLYCSSGSASCNDIDTSRSCICGGCKVYGEYKLADGQPPDHFCKNGMGKSQSGNR